MSANTRIFTLLLAILLLATSGGAAVGSYGSPVTSSTTGVVGVVQPFATAQIGFLDTNPADGNLGSGEAVFLTFFNDGAVHANDIILSNPSGSGVTGAAGSVVQTAPAGTLDYTVGATALTSLLRFIDTLPSYANGGPDGNFNPGEPLFLDADEDGVPSSADRLLVSGAGISGTLGGAPGSQSESTWDVATECVYQSADATSDATDALVSVDRPGCPALGSPLVAISSVVATSTTRTVADATTTSTSTTITSAGGNFVAGDVGFSIAGTGIPSGSRITAVTDANTVTISQAATADGTISLTVGLAAEYDPGEDAYIGSGTTVTTGHYRITDTASGNGGTLVGCGVFGNDADCGVAVSALTSPKVNMRTQALTLPTPPAPNAAGNGFAYFDANGNGAYDGSDRVVLDLDQNGFVTPADVRFSSAGGQTFGARPSMSDAEVHGRLSLAVTPTLIWLDSSTNPGQVDSAEPIAFTFGTAPHFLRLGDVCLTTVGGCSAGTQRTGATTAPTTGGTWTAVSTATNAGNLGYLDANNNNVYDLGDSLYLHFGAVPGNVAGGDLLLASDSGASGSRVTTAAGSLKALPGGILNYRAFDADGSGDFTVGDILYIDRANDQDAIPGDIRLSSGTGVTGFGRNLKEGDADAVLRLMASGVAGADAPIAFRDFDGSGGPSSEDPLYLLPRATGCPLVAADVLLSPGTLSATAGSFVAGDTAACTAVGAGPRFAYMPTGVYSTSSTLFLDMDGDGTLEVGDVRLTGGTSGAGSRISGSSSADMNSPVSLIPLGAALGTRANSVQLMVLDASGDGVAATQETVVLDIDGNGYVTPGDVPLSGTGTTGGTGGGGGGTGGGGTGGGTGGDTGGSNTGTGTSTDTATQTETATETHTDTDTATGNATETGNGSDEGIPSLGPVLVLALLGVALLVRRRL